MEIKIKEAIAIIEDIRKSMPECTNKAFLKGAINKLNEALKSNPDSASNTIPLDNVTRLEVINHKDEQKYGREYVNWKDDNKIEGLLQDSGRTLKIFITKR